MTVRRMARCSCLLLQRCLRHRLHSVAVPLVLHYHRRIVTACLRRGRCPPTAEASIDEACRLMDSSIGDNKDCCCSSCLEQATECGGKEQTTVGRRQLTLQIKHGKVGQNGNASRAVKAQRHEHLILRHCIVEVAVQR